MKFTFKDLKQLRENAPWSIPKQARIVAERKNGYFQLKFKWQTKGWFYEARWHEHVPGSRLVHRASWRLDRVKPGKGFGPNHASRKEETRVGVNWLPTTRVRYCAYLVNHGHATEFARQIIKEAHPSSKQ